MNNEWIDVNDKPPKAFNTVKNCSPFFIFEDAKGHVGMSFSLLEVQYKGNVMYYDDRYSMPLLCDILDGRFLPPANAQIIRWRKGTNDDLRKYEKERHK